MAAAVEHCVLAVSIEHCVAVRPTVSLKGSSERYTSTAQRLVELLRAALPTGVELAVAINKGNAAVRLAPRPMHQARSAIAHRQAPALPRASASCSRIAQPRTGAFEVWYRVLNADAAELCGGLLFSKLRTQRWPNIPLCVRALMRTFQEATSSSVISVGGLSWPTASHVRAPPRLGPGVGTVAPMKLQQCPSSAAPEAKDDGDLTGLTVVPAPPTAPAAGESLELGHEGAGQPASSERRPPPPLLPENSLRAAVAPSSKAPGHAQCCIRPAAFPGNVRPAPRLNDVSAGHPQRLRAALGRYSIAERRAARQEMDSFTAPLSGAAAQHAASARAAAPVLRPYRVIQPVLPKAVSLTFVSANPTVARALLARGWTAGDVHSASFVWAVRRSEIDFSCLAPSAFCNFFERTSKVTTKVGLARCLQAAAPRTASPHEPAAQREEPPRHWRYFPRSFDLSDERSVSAFEADVRLAAAFIVMRRIAQFGICGVKSMQLGGSRVVHDSLAALAVRHVLDEASHVLRPRAVPGLDLLAFPPPTSEDMALLCLAPGLLTAAFGWGATDDAVAETELEPMRERLRELTRMLLEELLRAFPHLALDGSENVWILKPAYGSKGKGLQLIKANASGLRQVLKLRGAARVVQRYVERPLLIHHRKFDIRLYALTLGWEQPGTVWLYSRMLLKLCSEPYCLSRLNERYRHLTNCSVQREREHRPEEEVAAGSLVWTSDRFIAHLDECGYGSTVWEQHVFPSLCAVAKAALSAGQQSQDVNCSPPRRSSFEIVGLDVILDEALRPWLLEVNESPNLRDFGGEVLEPMLDELVGMVSAVARGEEPTATASPAPASKGWICI